MAKTGHIFLSYRKTEESLPLKMAADLKIAGIKVWMDQLDGIVVGMDWLDTIQQALDDSSAFIAVISPEYLDSEYCQKELKYAAARKLPIYPILLYPVDPMPLVLTAIQYEDFTRWQQAEEYAKHFAKLLQRLRSNEPTLQGDAPSAEVAYLIRLIADMESYKGVLEYVEPFAQVSGSERPNPRREGWPQEFIYLVPENQQLPPVDVDIETAEQTYGRFVLIGDPGGGKTTTLRRLASQAARKRLNDSRTAPLPVYIELPAWRDEKEPLDLVRSHYPFEIDSLTDMLASGDICLYFDGLNEMGGLGKKNAEKLKAWLHGDAAPQHVIFTCRALDYIGDLDLDLPTIQIEPLNIEQIKALAQNYLQEKSTDFLSRVLPANDDVAADNRHIIHLIHNPYMLASLIFIYQISPDGELPRNQGRLFGHLAKTLWNREQQKHPKAWIPFELAEAAFGRLAFAMIDDYMPNEISNSYALKHLKYGKQRFIGFTRGKDCSFLKAGENAGWIQATDNKIRFIHQLLQEYLASRHIIQNSISPTIWIDKARDKAYQRHLKRMKKDKEFAKQWINSNPPYKSNIAESIWSMEGYIHVVTLVCQNSPDPELFISEIVDQNIFLAAECASTTPVSERLAGTIGQILLELYRGDQQQQVAARLLGKLGDSMIPKLAEIFHDERGNWSYYYYPAKILANMSIRGQDVVIDLLHRQGNHDIRFAIVKALQGINDSRLIPELITALSDEASGVRGEAYEALSQMGKSAFPYLVEAIETSNGRSREMIVKILGEYSDVTSTSGGDRLTDA